MRVATVLSLTRLSVGRVKMEPSAVPVPVEEPDSTKEGINLSARTMTGTNAAGGTFGLGLDQFELPKASIAKLARSEVPAASHDVAIARGNKTISAAHVMDAMRELDFPPHMRRELREQLEAYRDLLKKQAAARAEAAQQSRERAKAARAAAAAEAMEVEASGPSDEKSAEGAVEVPVAAADAPAADVPAAAADVPAAASTEIPPA
ncbi:DNA-directed DNA polymerase [Malassezia caprae]|uniref:DNA-directed DNA polymerase n=1 Tax=Malassezia caprae TaxID=1381934 RepID=A0AAF0IVG1_9BASI|nr:DNA-directed DNA polymerase [Malassezia caprae]